MSNRKETVIRYSLSFCIPFVMYMIIGVLLKLHPLSDNTLLFSDMNTQFVSFFNFFKNQFSTNNDFFYTFSKNLGGDMTGFSAYYLHNPFLFLLFLFPYKYMPLGIFIMEALMLSFASLSFMHYLEKVFGKGSLIFSTCYGMMGYVMAYFTLPIYFCNIILLPLVLIGFYSMMEENARFRDCVYYIVLLALSIYCNYYIGYMLCLFLALYYAYYCGCRQKIVKMGKFIGCSALGVMLSCFNLVPVVLSLRDQKDAPASSIFNISRVFRLTRLYRNLIPGTYNMDSSNSSMPYIYVGIIPVLCVLVVFLSKKIRLNEKIATLFIICAFLISFYTKPFNTIWHAFNEPVGFAHRFAFYFSFLILSIGYRGYLLAGEHLNEMKINIRRSSIIALIMAFTFLELFYNAHHSLKLESVNSARESEYFDFYEKMEPVLTQIYAKEGENSLYRLEKDMQYTMVDPMAFNYAGLSHNSSCEKARVKDFMGKMGFRNQGIWAFYNQGSTTFADSFLGLKYLISRFDTSDKPYELINNTEDAYVFENPFALGFASVMDSDRVVEVSRKIDSESDTYLAKAGSGISNDGNTFEMQNEIASCYGLADDIFEEAVVPEIRVTDNVELSERFVSHLNTNAVNITNIKETDEEKYIEFDIDVKESGKTLYMYFPAPFMQGARIYVNGIDWDDYFSDWRWAVEKIGTFSKGDRVTVKILATGDSLALDDYQFYYEDYEALNNWYENAQILGAGNVSLNKVTSSHITGKYTAAKNGMLVFSIPDEKGWEVKIDGKKVSHERVLYVLMGVETEAGEHTIDMKYVPEGLLFGCIISAIAFIICMYIIIKEKHLG